MTEEEYKKTKERYIQILEQLFLPKDPCGNDIVNYFSSLLRVVGVEDKGWDPYLESKGILEDLNAILQSKHSDEIFPNKDATMWRIGLLMYSHIVEMDAPYEVVTNLLLFRLGKGYSPNPYYQFLNGKEKKRFRSSGIYPSQKIKIIKNLSEDAGIPEVGNLFDEFYDGKLRNAISHSDYTLTEEDFRVRNGTGAFDAYKISLEKLNITITKAKIFISSIYSLDNSARHVWGKNKHRGIPYDPVYKGLIEVLVDDEDLMCGFKIHWPNNSESTYRRTKSGIDMVNCHLDLKNSTIEFMVGLYAQNPGEFSPLVENKGTSVYTKLEGRGEVPVWEE